jgi:hypothetical protein
MFFQIARVAIIIDYNKEYFGASIKNRKAALERQLFKKMYLLRINLLRLIF